MSMNTPPHTLVIFGTLIDAPTPYELRLRRRHVCQVDTLQGKIVRLEPEENIDLKEIPSGLGVDTLRLSETQAVAVGLIDCHIHAAQYNQLGTKTDIPLMEWLNKYTFPEEAHFKDKQHCHQTYDKLITRLLRNGTTTAVYYSSNHLSSAQALADTAWRLKQRAYVGKVCSDQNVPNYYVEKTDQSVSDTEEFLKWVQGQYGQPCTSKGRNVREARIQAVITPRFIPTCSWELLCELGKLAKKYDAFVQTHAAESVDEVTFVAALYPQKKRDIKILEEAGLLTGKTILAHCCHLNDSEVGDIVRKDVGIVSCPFSNMLFAQSVVDIPRYYNYPQQNDNFVMPSTESMRKIGLGTDIAGGPSSSLWTNIRLAIAQDRIPSFRNMASYPASDSHPTNTEPPAWYMTHTYAYHIATVGGAATIGMADLLGVWEVGRLFDGFLVDWDRPSEEQAFDSPVCVSAANTVQSHEEWEAHVKDGWERFVMGGDDRNILAVWVDGTEAFRRLV